MSLRLSVILLLGALCLSDGFRLRRGRNLRAARAPTDEDEEYTSQYDSDPAEDLEGKSWKSLECQDAKSSSPPHLDEPTMIALFF